MVTKTAKKTNRKKRIMNPFSIRERDVLKPRPDWLPIEWAEVKVILPDGPAKGPFHRRTMPLLTSPINSIVNPAYESIVAMAGTQVGKSMSLNQIPLGYFLEYKREDTGFGIPNKNIAKRVYKTKLAPMFRAVADLHKLLPSTGAGSQGGFPTELMLNNGVLALFMGAGSAADMAQATLKNCIVDETDKSDESKADDKEGTKINQFTQRTSAHMLTRKLIYTCTPTNSKGFISKAYAEGTEGKPYVRCVHCGEWFYYRWDWENQQIGWDDDTNELTAMQTAYYPCPHCKEKLSDDDRLITLRHPLWVHAGEHIESCSKDEAICTDAFTEAVSIGDESFIVRGERKGTRMISFWWNRLYSPFVTIGHLAGLVRNGRDDEMKKKDVCIYEMGLPYDGRILDTSEITIESVLAHASYSDYQHGRKGRMPFVYNAENMAVMVGIDIGLHELYMIARLYEVNENGNLIRSWLVDYLIPYRYPNPDEPQSILRALESVRNYLSRGWKDSAGNVFYPTLIGIDSGFQHGKKRSRGDRIVPADSQVYNFCKKYSLQTWRPVDGRDSLGGTGIVEMVKLEKHLCYIWAIDTDIAKIEIHDQLKVQAGGVGFWHIPRDVPRNYARGLCAEQRIVKFDDKNNPTAEWNKTDPYNHPLDCEVYAWAMARHKGVKPPLREEPEIVEDSASQN